MATIIDRRCPKHDVPLWRSAQDVVFCPDCNDEPDDGPRCRSCGRALGDHADDLPTLCAGCDARDDDPCDE